MDTLSLIAIIIGSLLLCGAIALVFRPLIPASLAAYAGLWAFHFSGGYDISMEQLLFWGVATLLVIGIDFLLPKTKTIDLKGRGYVGLGTLAAMVVGMLFGSPGIILGAAIGAFFGALAYGRTPQGAALQFPSSKFLSFLCARGLPAVVAFSMVGIVMFQSLKLAGY